MDSETDSFNLKDPTLYYYYRYFIAEEKLRLREVNWFMQGHHVRTRIWTQFVWSQKPSLFPLYHIPIQPEEVILEKKNDGAHGD